MEDDPRYVRAWRDYRWRLGLAVAGFPTFPVIWFLTVSGLGDRVPSVVVGLVLFAVPLVTWTRLIVWRCPHCGHPFFHVGFFKNPCARECMHCGLPKWCCAPDVHPRASVPPGPPPQLRAEVRFLTRAEGGRVTAAISGYRAQLRYDDRDRDAVFAFLWGDMVRPGETAVVHVWLPSPAPHVGKLYPGKSVEIREGERVVARGVVTALLALEGQASTGG